MVPTAEPDVRFSRAVAALDRADFRAARSDLEWLVSRCEAGRRGRTALLLFASAELDPRNPEASPRIRRGAGRPYLQLPWVEDAEVPVASTLYLLARDRVGSGRAQASRQDLDTVAADSTPADSAAVQIPDTLTADSAAAPRGDSATVPPGPTLPPLGGPLRSL